MEIGFIFEIDGYPDQIFKVVLDNVTYQIRMVWIERDESWLMYIGEVGSDPTISFKVVSCVDLLANYKQLDGVPSGELWLFSFRNFDARVGRYTIGPVGEMYMAYYTNDEEAADVD